MRSCGNAGCERSSARNDPVSCSLDPLRNHSKIGEDFTWERQPVAFLKHTLTTLWEGLGLATWVKISTTNPPCLYYFGPFLSEAEAQDYRPAFLRDLEEEGAQGIETEILQCPRPAELTLDHSQSSSANHPCPEIEWMEREDD